MYSRFEQNVRKTFKEKDYRNKNWRKCDKKERDSMKENTYLRGEIKLNRSS